eukprot:CCRYP_008605-RA/>CCRYP_008605-RA protein AED:0.24 eAED:0.24 QI:0/0.5/0.33/1/0/0/3/3414/69
MGSTSHSFAYYMARGAGGGCTSTSVEFLREEGTDDLFSMLKNTHGAVCGMRSKPSLLLNEPFFQSRCTR